MYCHSEGYISPEENSRVTSAHHFEVYFMSFSKISIIFKINWFIFTKLKILIKMIDTYLFLEREEVELISNSPNLQNAE